MIPYIRRNKIIEELENKDIIYIDDFLSIFENVSSSTIRRDLKILEEEGRIVMLRGGAVKLRDNSFDIPVETKKFLNINEKDQIGQLAASLVEDGDVIYLDSGTTCLQMVKYLNNKQITVITSGTQVLNELDGDNVHCIIVGGEVNKATDSIAGPLTDSNLKNLFFDKAFLGASGISLEGGINTPDFREASKKAIVKTNSKECYVLADSSKFNKNTLCKAMDLNECTIITDKINELFEKETTFIDTNHWEKVK
ncbi:DeoR/GlpR family DNA-binding transcription regulator [Domibacillus sp. DTU_2020_1001157_1_SI_ALB_TIR_016]|uniref:DeoR/GlpR family DNA-binding transcription regulator n=1 Tax=Domibacillus sp. DTU_2020_1001157_1_SI_ALB_TIR_016 TaxID=3077789 RepID=UPI0028E4404E|nr:DeoR/GlpR family DNA-binding transcription regulator [Domibacillus sp. DTU_2020_1001157_1_SI_ALB_TIR_016]WNS79404.1 DeoR/GlpR family DNA-binding transcription regulator [Domibacillus sp. DTU_2020_1001157_1_SI_ALB_TIR_016]